MKKGTAFVTTGCLLLVAMLVNLVVLHLWVGLLLGGLGVLSFYMGMRGK